MGVTRLAPTPSGYLHLGNIYNFWLTDRLRKKQNLKLILRIDDTDKNRCRSEYIEDIFDSLEWLNIKVDETVYASHFDDKAKALLKKIPHYECICSRKELIQRGVKIKYDGYCRNKNKKNNDLEVGIRFKEEKENPLGDFIIWQKEDIPSYQLSSVLLDRELKVTTIIRGVDLVHSTQAQQRLAEYIDYVFPTGEKIIHHQLLTTPKGDKLSKSNHSLSFREWRKEKTLEDLNSFFLEVTLPSSLN